MSGVVDQAPAALVGTWRSALRAITDEGVFGVAHLLVHWHLARSLAPAGYGAFALAMMWGLLAVSTHHAFVVEPLLVASVSPLGRAPGYLRAVLQLHGVVAGLAAAPLALAAWLLPRHVPFSREAAASAVLVLGLSSVRLVRGMAYAQLPQRAGTMTVVGYAFMTGAGLLALTWLSRTSGAAALLLMGTAGLSAAAVVLVVYAPPATNPSQLKATLRYHWQHGRWLLPLAPLRWAVDSLPLVILGFTGQLGQVAMLRAAQNLTAPAIQLVGVTRLMLIPRFAQARKLGKLWPFVQATQLVTLAASALFFVAMTLGGSLLLRVYGGRYTEAHKLLPLLALTPGLLGSALLFGNVLRVGDRSDLSLSAFAAASLVGGVTAAVAATHHGAWGAAVALVAGYATLLLFKGWLAFSKTRAQPPR